MQKIIGGILIAFGVADFALSWLGINLTPFLPPQIATFSPKMHQNGNFFIRNVSKWWLFHQKCATMATFSRKMRQHGYFFTRNVSKLQFFH